MNQMLSYNMMTGNPLLWIAIGLLLGLLLVVAVTWLLASFRNRQRSAQMRSAPLAQDAFQTYEQGYQATEPSSEELYQEGGRSYSYRQPAYERPIAQYPQEIPSLAMTADRFGRREEET